MTPHSPIAAMRRQRSLYTDPFLPGGGGWGRHQGPDHGTHDSADVDGASPQGTVCGWVNLEVQALLQQLQADVYDILFKLQGTRRKRASHACCVWTNKEIDNLYPSDPQGSVE